LTSDNSLKTELVTLIRQGNWRELFCMLLSLSFIMTLMTLFCLGAPAMALYTLVTGVCKV